MKNRFDSTLTVAVASPRAINVGSRELSIPARQKSDRCERWEAEPWNKVFILKRSACKMNQLSEALGVDEKSLSTIVYLFATIPLSLIYGRISSESLKHLFSIIATPLLYCSLFPSKGLLSIFLLSLFCFHLTKLVKSRNVGWIVFAISMTWLSSIHIGRYRGEGDWDHTSPAMVLVIKLSRYSWWYSDNLRKDAKFKGLSLIPFLGYIFFFGSFLVGPAFSVETYLEFTRQNTDRHWLAFAKKMGIAIAAMSTYLYFPTYNYDATLTPVFAAQPVLLKFWKFTAIGFISRLKFYLAWNLSEASCCLAGLPSLSNILFWKVEFPENPREMMNVLYFFYW